MKKPSSSIRIEKPAGGKPAGPGALPGGVVFLAGLWAGVWQWLHPAGSPAPAVLPIAAAAAALCLGLLVRWEKPGRLAALAAVLVYPVLGQQPRHVRNAAGLILIIYYQRRLLGGEAQRHTV